MHRSAILLVLIMLAAACGSTPATSEGGGSVSAPEAADQGGSNAMCAPDMPDCVDAAVEPASDGDAMTPKQLRRTARDLLGLAQSDLPGDVRIGRRGDEQMPLIEDYRVGRMTVELDEDEAGVYRVTSVVLELPEGPETFTTKG